MATGRDRLPRITLFFRLFGAMALAGLLMAVAGLLMIRWTALSSMTAPQHSSHAQRVQLETLQRELVARRHQARGWGFLPADEDARERWWRTAIAQSQVAACTGTRPASPVCTPTLADRVALLDVNGHVLAGVVPHRFLIAFASINTLRIGLVDTDGTVGMLQIADPGNPRDELVAAFLMQRQTRLFWASVAAFSAMLAAAAILAWRFRRPIRQLQAGANRLASGDFESRLPAARSDELGDLARTFNRMAERLQVMDAAQRRWMSDSAHELRTPLAVLQAQIEAMADGVRPMTAPNLQLLLRQTRALERLVGDLHALALADNEEPLSHREPCHVWPLLEQCATAFAERITATGLALQLSPAPAHALVLGDPVRLQQLFDNLLENCVRYTTTGGRIIVEGNNVDGTLRVCIDDTAPGVPPDMLPRLCERFFRADAARTRGGAPGRTGGSGLGLALCLRITNAHGGELRFEPSPLGGLRAIVILPLAD